MLKAVIFDFDGTLCDTLPLCVASFQECLQKRLGASVDAMAIERIFGMSEPGVLRAFLPEAEVDAAFAEFLEIYRRRLARHCSAPFPGIVELLDELRAAGVKTGIVTGKGPETLAHSLAAMALADRFDAAEAGSPLGNVKAEKIASLLDVWALRPDEALYVGDAASDITASRRAGVPVAAAAWAASSHPAELRELHPDLLAGSIAELRDAIRRRMAAEA